MKFTLSKLSIQNVLPTQKRALSAKTQKRMPRVLKEKKKTAEKQYF